MAQEKITLEGFLEQVGRSRFRKGIGRSEQLMVRASAQGKMPAGWYRDVRDWCVANRVDVPEHLFKWGRASVRGGHSKQNVYSDAADQGAVINDQP